MNSWLESWTGLVLASPWALLALPLVLLAALLGDRLPAVRFAPAGFLRRGADGRTRPLPHSLRQRCAPLPRALRTAGLGALVVALSWPQERVPLPLQREGLDVLLCIDVSSSMVADDLERGRTRLDVTKRAAREFVAQRADDRIGLVTFARYPDLVCPPTTDHDSLRAMLDAIEPVVADGDEDATGIGMAVARCATALRASTASSKVVVLLTDGEENVALGDQPQEIPPLKAARLCAELGVRVYAIAAGIGKQMPGGQWVDLDTRPLEQLAARTGGASFTARDASAVTRVYTTIGELERSAFAAPRYEYADRYLGFLVAGLLLWALGRLAATTVFGSLP